MTTRFTFWTFSFLVALLFVLQICTVHAHDNYTGIQNKAGSLCCGGDPVTGDCEHFEEGYFSVLPNGDAKFVSFRYKATILVARDKVEWLALPPMEDGKEYPAHWCGLRRGDTKPTPDQPDVAFITRCAFIAPGGV